MKGNFILGWKDLVFLFIPAASYQFACPPQPTIAIRILGPPPQPCPPPRPWQQPVPLPRSRLLCLLWHPFLLFILPSGAPLSQHPVRPRLGTADS